MSKVMDEWNEKYGPTPLMMAALEGNVREVKSLLKSGTDPWERRMEACALEFCVLGSKKGNVEVAKLLLDHPSKPRKGYVEKAFITACGRGEERMVEFFLDRGINVNLVVKPRSSDPTQTGPGLLAAAILGRTDIMELLIERGADLDKSDYEGYSVLWRLLQGRNKDEGVARSTLVLLDAVGLTPMSKFDGKTIESRFEDPDAKEVILEARRQYREKALAESAEDPMVGAGKSTVKKKTSSGPSL